MFIEISVILARMKSSVLFLDKEKGESLEGLGFLDFTQFEMFINELLTGIHLLRVEWVCLSYLGDKGILQVYSMVKWSSWGKFPCFRFIKHFGIGSILGKDFVLYLFHSLSQGGGQGELP